MIRFTQTGFAYGQHQILRDVTLHLAPGSFHFLTGASGAGKSTLLKLCYLALRPGAGQMHVLGEDVVALSRDDVALVRQRIGVVHQDCQFLDHLSVAENVLLPLELAGRMGPTSRDNLRELLSWVGLSGRERAFPPELSGGERQRAALARALILSPEVILADEPTGNVDRDMGERLLHLLVELNRMGRTILLATHDLSLIRSAKREVPARVLRLRDGVVELAGAEL